MHHQSGFATAGRSKNQKVAERERLVHDMELECIGLAARGGKPANGGRAKRAFQHTGCGMREGPYRCNILIAKIKTCHHPPARGQQATLTRFGQAEEPAGRRTGCLDGITDTLITENDGNLLDQKIERFCRFGACNNTELRGKQSDIARREILEKGVCFLRCRRVTEPRAFFRFLPTLEKHCGLIASPGLADLTDFNVTLQGQDFSHEPGRDLFGPMGDRDDLLEFLLRNIRRYCAANFVKRDIGGG